MFTLFYHWHHSQLLPCFVEVILLPGRTLIIGPCCGGDETDKLVIWKHRIGQAEWKIECVHIAMRCTPASKSKKMWFRFWKHHLSTRVLAPHWLVVAATGGESRPSETESENLRPSELRPPKILSQLSLTPSASCKGPLTVRTPLDKN